MSRVNRIYQNNQVEFSLCSCLKQVVKTQNNSTTSPIDQQLDKKIIYHSHINGQNSKNKNGWLKLSKNIITQQKSLNINVNKIKKYEEDIIQQPLITNKHSFIPLIKIIQPYSYKQRGRSTDVNFSFPTSFRQSNKQLINYNLNQINYHNEQRNYLLNQQNEQKYKKQIKQQYPLFSSINLRTTCNQTYIPCNKYNSTSSTTLFETKNHVEDSINKQKIKPLEEKQQKQQKQQKLEKIKERSRTTGNRKMQSENIGLNIVDFSRVREVQTVMSQSFSFSYLDAISEAHPSSSNLIINKQVKKQFNSTQMESQIKRLLQN